MSAAEPGAEPVSTPHRYEQHFLTAPDGTRLHADVLRPTNLPEDAKTPVILTVSPYRSHTAYISAPRLTGGPSTDYLPVDAALRAGYTFVIVDLRGFGGSDGCPDYGGPGERSDVATAVEWAATRPWSTGRVGMVGVSYEAWTGLLGLAARPRGLAAVVAFEPVVDPYSYLYMRGVSWKFSGKPVTENGIRPADEVGLEHVAIASTPGRPDDSVEYQANAVYTSAECTRRYLALTGDHDATDPDWVARDLVTELRGNTIPLFLGQGFLDANTRPDRVFELWRGLGAGAHRAWFGQWGHSDCRFKCGTPGFENEMMAFFDRHVALRDTDVPWPRVTVQQFDGGWRSENTWPPADSRRSTVELRAGRYVDRGYLPGPDREIWSVSQPLESAVHLSGVPTATLESIGPAAATAAVELYDVEPSGRATIITRGIAPVEPRTEIRLLAQDWPIAAGHRLGVRVTDVVDDVWSHAPSGATVTVTAARLEVPLLTEARVPDLTGGGSEAHAKWRVEKTTTLGAEVMNNAVVPMNLVSTNPPHETGQR
ncbi:CocE/NonD family hydrolase [Nocardia sp. NEAU-351]|uniref:CocE/NonD family hydrolase n=2 Tax=Nocardia bovistercoris TaxID=2785916 RepID=A0A931IEK3_9NOCA|nr:CocE/NonD family hydrolase [Nocardia bovistercoris]MBH0779999.1 CocE/NonD family hydrolase [Nocardia bovistercoris]